MDVHHGIDHTDDDGIDGARDKYHDPVTEENHDDEDKFDDDVVVIITITMALTNSMSIDMMSITTMVLLFPASSGCLRSRDGYTTMKLMLTPSQASIQLLPVKSSI